MIYKKDLLEKYKKRDKKHILTLEKRIDSELKKKKMPVSVPVDDFEHSVIETIKQRYEDEGKFTVSRNFGSAREPCNELVVS